MSDKIIEVRWRSCLEKLSVPARKLLADVVLHHAEAAIDRFYDELLQDAEASAFFGNARISIQLRRALTAWMKNLFLKTNPANVGELVDEQNTIGGAHARMNIPTNFFVRGFGVIQSYLIKTLLRTQASAVEIEASLAVVDIINFASEIVIDRYTHAHEIDSKMEEAYRIFNINMDATLEREKLRSALYDWESRFLQTVLIGRVAESAPLTESYLGVWMRHKAKLLEISTEDYINIEKQIKSIDENLQKMQREVFLGDIKRHSQVILLESGKIRLAIDLVFEKLVNIENSKDQATQLLNKRFLSTILSQEIEISRALGSSFATLFVAFNNIGAMENNSGAQACDHVLRHFTTAFRSKIRAGDFLFRYDESELLLVCVETSPEEVVRMAQELSWAVEAERNSACDPIIASVEAHIGVAVFDGHPDYRLLIERAASAAQMARQAGEPFHIFDA